MRLQGSPSLPRPVSPAFSAVNYKIGETRTLSALQPALNTALPDVFEPNGSPSRIQGYVFTGLEPSDLRTLSATQPPQVFDHTCRLASNVTVTESLFKRAVPGLQTIARTTRDTIAPAVVNLAASLNEANTQKNVLLGSQPARQKLADALNLQIKTIREATADLPTDSRLFRSPGATSRKPAITQPQQVLETVLDAGGTLSELNHYPAVTWTEQAVKDLLKPASGKPSDIAWLAKVAQERAAVVTGMQAQLDAAPGLAEAAARTCHSLAAQLHHLVVPSTTRILSAGSKNSRQDILARQLSDTLQALQTTLAQFPSAYSRVSRPRRGG